MQVVFVGGLVVKAETIVFRRPVQWHRACENHEGHDKTPGYCQKVETA
jgi:hypothetical protein